jgi:hypothetical protein
VSRGCGKTFGLSETDGAMLLVIFGAGASFDSVDVTAVRQVQQAPNHRPPLATDLFSDRPNFNAVAARYPQFGGRILPFRRAARSQGFDVEKELQAIRDETEAYPAAASELAAVQFYLRDVMTECGDQWFARSAGVTNYRELLSRIDRYRVTVAPRLERDPLVALVTFNYDTLLDRAVAEHPVRLSTTTIEDYGGREPYKLFKPHGSVDWGQIVEWTPQQMINEQIVRFLIENIGSLALTGRYLKACGQVTVQVEGSPYRWPLLPAIAIPVVEKSEFACPDEHLALLAECLSRITHVIIIGWRGSEQHFLDRFVRRLASAAFLVVAGSRDEAIATKETLAERGGVSPERIHISDQNGFTHFLASADLESFLGG